MALNGLNPLGSPTPSPLGNRLQDLQKRIASDAAAVLAPGSGATADAAEITESTRLTTRLRGLRQASENIQYGQSLTQTADGVLGGVSDSLQRIRELTVQGANGTLAASDRTAIQNEIDQLSESIDSTVATATFNGRSVFGRTIELQVGAEGRIPVEFPELSVRVLADGPIEATNVQAAQYSLPRIDQAIGNVSEVRQNFGAVQSRLSRSLSEVEVATQNVVSASVGQGNLAEAITDLKLSATQYKLALKASAAALRTDEAVLDLLK